MKNPTPYFFHLTGDSSPSLSLGEQGEWMHHRGGAFSETLHVYGAAVECTLSHDLPPEFICVGLGLGYLEILLAAQAARSRQMSRFRVLSFESDPFLSSVFLEWVQGKQIPSEFEKVYSQILELTSRHFDIPSSQIRSALKEWLDSKQWRIQGALNSDTLWPQRYSCALFDAFSSHTSPELWKEELLGIFLESGCAEQSIFATYASTGDLKRLLTKHRFAVSPRTGFSGKRECTLAARAI